MENELEIEVKRRVKESLIRNEIALDDHTLEVFTELIRIDMRKEMRWLNGLPEK